MPKNS